MTGRPLAVFVGVLACLNLFAEGTLLRVFDATGIDSPAVNEISFALARRNGWELSFRRLETGAALEKLACGECDVVLAAASRVPASFDGSRKVYAHYALIAVVNAVNPVRKITREQLRRVFIDIRPGWAALGGDDVDIHRIVVRGGDGRMRGIDELNIFAAAAAVLPVETMNEAVLLAEGDPASLAWGGYLAELPVRTVALAVDGVAPSRKNIRNSRYPLATVCVALARRDAAPAAREFLRALGSAEFAGMLENEGALPPEAGGSEPSFGGKR